MNDSGILLINKPAGITSHDVVNQIRRLMGTKQVGHTGTLDPMATGLLTVLVGRAVKASEYAMAEKKRYLATLSLGMTSDTEDSTGTVLTHSDSLPDCHTVLAVLDRFRGEIMQTPPMVSAIKVGGKTLMALAREGKVIERQARPITVHRLLCTPMDEGSGQYALDVTCSKGTYIRTLCADIGRALGCGGVMSSLCRTENGPHRLADAVTPETLAQMPPDARASLLRPVEGLFEGYPILHLPPFFARLALDGNAIALKKLPHASTIALAPGDFVRFYDDGGFFSLARVDDMGETVKAVKKFRV